jgi:8-oxo-dGTP diphosphatase
MDSLIPQLAVGALIVRDHEVLLVKRGQPPRQNQWCLPGGKVHRDETLAAAVRREVNEETGLTVEPLYPVYLLEFIASPGTSGGHHYLIVDYLARPVSGTPQPGDDAMELAWFTPDALSGLGNTLDRDSRKLIDLWTADELTPLTITTISG